MSLERYLWVHLCISTSICAPIERLVSYLSIYMLCNIRFCIAANVQPRNKRITRTKWYLIGIQFTITRSNRNLRVLTQICITYAGYWNINKGFIHLPIVIGGSLKFTLKDCNAGIHGITMFTFSMICEYTTYFVKIHLYHMYICEIDRLSQPVALAWKIHSDIRQMNKRWWNIHTDCEYLGQIAWHFCGHIFFRFCFRIFMLMRRNETK